MASGDYVVGQLDSLVQRVAGEHGYLLLDRVLLDLRVKTADLPYVIIDRHGLLIVSVEYWPGAAITGTSAATQWSAKSASLGKAKFGNPFAANRNRCAVLQETLVVCGRSLPVQYITSLVVFLGADISKLKLEPGDAAKMIDARQFESWIRDRADFPPNEGALEDGDLEDLRSLLQAVNRSDNDEVQARHARSRLEPDAAKGAATEVALADSVAGVAPSAPRLTPDRYPTATAAKAARSTSVLALLAVAAFVVWLSAYGGYGHVTDRLAQFASLSLSGPPSAPDPVVMPAASPAPDTMLAKRALAEVAHHLVPKVENMDSPAIGSENGATLYTWNYVEMGSGTARRGTFTLGLDASGNVVHVSQQ